MKDGRECLYYFFLYGKREREREIIIYISCYAGRFFAPNRLSRASTAACR